MEIMNIIYYLFLILCFVVGALALLVLSNPRCGVPPPRVIYKTIGRDLRALVMYLRGRTYVMLCAYRNEATHHFFQKLARKHPNKACFLYGDQKWTFQEVEDFSNKIANYFDDLGFQKGDEVALFMENRPEYPAIWLGLSKIGVIPALINTNLRLNTLANSLHVIKCKALIYGTELDSAVRDVIPLLENKETLERFTLGASADPAEPLAKSLEVVLKNASSEPPDNNKHKIGFSDKLLYIYTSGTTGLPKAAVIRHSRLIWASVLCKFFIRIQDTDIIYNPLPMYHTAGGLLTLSCVLSFGGTMAIRKKFSASNFWTDAIKYNATVSLYIGEICRYLIAQPKKPEDTQHKIRMMVGNGLRKQIWTEFMQRFNIQKIAEFYGSTEGNANVVNIDGRIGAVGFLPRSLSFVYPVTLVRTDPDTGDVIRDSNGLCIPCMPGEPGHMVGKIVSHNPINAFDGYVDRKATQKKIIRNCFRKGDMAFLSGDILVMDEEGYLYFMDRTGDTFRWKGENVSTNEVESIISKVLGQVACAVYGVEIPGMEGRAGMAAIQGTEDKLDMQSFYGKIRTSLPSYAIPLFVRICSDIEATGTYKVRKVELQKEGFDIEKIKDPLYILDPKERSYVKLDKERYQKIIDGRIKL